MMLAAASPLAIVPVVFYPASMPIETLGDALTAGWRVHARLSSNLSPEIGMSRTRGPDVPDMTSTDLSVGNCSLDAYPLP
jgi:hypothetical protein